MSDIRSQVAEAREKEAAARQREREIADARSLRANELYQLNYRIDILAKANDLPALKDGLIEREALQRILAVLDEQLADAQQKREAAEQEHNRAWSIIGQWEKDLETWQNQLIPGGPLDQQIEEAEVMARRAESQRAGAIGNKERLRRQIDSARETIAAIRQDAREPEQEQNQ